MLAIQTAHNLPALHISPVSALVSVLLSCCNLCNHNKRNHDCKFVILMYTQGICHTITACTVGFRVQNLNTRPYMYAFGMQLRGGSLAAAVPLRLLAEGLVGGLPWHRQ